MMIRPITTGYERSDADEALFYLLRLCGCKNIAINEFYKQSSTAKSYLAVTFSCDSTDIKNTLSILLPSFKIHKDKNQYLIYGDEDAVAFFLRYFLIQTLISIQKQFPILACETKPSNVKFLYNMKGGSRHGQEEEGCLLEDFFNDKILLRTNDNNKKSGGEEALRTLSSLGVAPRRIVTQKASFLTQNECGIFEDKNGRIRTYSLIVISNIKLFFEAAILPSIQAINEIRKSKIALLSGLHERCGKQSFLSQVVKKSLFDPQTLRLVFNKLGSPKLAQLLTPPNETVASLKKYNTASNSDQKEIEDSIKLVYRNMICPKFVTQSKREEGEATVTEGSNYELSNFIRSYGIITSRRAEGGLPSNVYQTFLNNVKLQNALRMLDAASETYATPANFYKLCGNKNLVVVEALAAAYDYWKSANFNNSSTPGFFISHGWHGKNVTIAFVDNLMKVVKENHTPQQLSSLVDAYTKEWYRTSDPDKEGSRAAYAKRHGLFKDDNHQKLGLADTIMSLKMTLR